MQTSAWDNLDNKINEVSKNKVPKIAVCIPYKGNWDPEWVEKTYLPLETKHTDFCDKVHFLSKAPSLPVARDALVISALQNNCDYLFFLDTDHVFEYPLDPNMALKVLYDCINKDTNTKDGKIVSGLYVAKQRTGFNYAMWLKYRDEKGVLHEDKFTPVQQWNGNWIQVDTVGFGCCLIDMNIFKTVPRPWFVWNTVDDNSEDFYFCVQARKHGYNIHVMTDIKLSHSGYIKLKSDRTISIPDL